MHKQVNICPILFTFILIMGGCRHSHENTTTPWGDTLDVDGVVTDTAATTRLSFSDIQENGELIMLTLPGADTYFSYHGRSVGTQYLMCEKFAQRMGVVLRVEVCRDTADVYKRLSNGEGDVAAVQLRRKEKGILYCGADNTSGTTSWAVAPSSTELADSLNKWYSASVLADVQKEEKYIFSSHSIKRHVYAPVLNASRGEISSYDHLFKMYAPMVRWDWRLLAAQCYQESTFDPHAYSWAGARGLMQIMPMTAAELGLAESDLYAPQANIEAAVRYIAKLNGMFKDIRNAGERINFVLASYNGGHFHIRDAMALARQNGKNPYSWDNVREYVLKLSSPAYYSDPVVKYGYMRGSETVDYVYKIKNRWNTYRQKVSGNRGFSQEDSSNDYVPRRATRKNRYKI